MSKPGLLHCRWSLESLRHQGSPKIFCIDNKYKNFQNCFSCLQNQCLFYICNTFNLNQPHFKHSVTICGCGYLIGQHYSRDSCWKVLWWARQIQSSHIACTLIGKAVIHKWILILYLQQEQMKKQKCQARASANSNSYTSKLSLGLGLGQGEEIQVLYIVSPIRFVMN